VSAKGARSSTAWRSIPLIAGPRLNCLVYLRIVSLLIDSRVDQVLRVLVGRHQASHLSGGFTMDRIADFALEAADAAEDIDRRVVVASSELTTQYEVSVEDSAHRVRDGFVEVVSFDEDGEESGDRTGLAGAAPFEQLWKDGVHRRGKAPGRRALTAGKPDLALCPGKPGDRIKHEHHVQALVPEKTPPPP
jgi:hypothetical protein